MELQRLHSIGFNNWYSKVLELAHLYKIEPEELTFCEATKTNIKRAVRNIFVQSWQSDLHNVSLYPSLRTYNRFKIDFKPEPYLNIIKKSKYNIAFSRFRAGSHTLEIERGRYSNPRTPVENRLCTMCQEIEDEKHFLISCKLYHCERINLFSKINKLVPHFRLSSDVEKFVFLLSNRNEQLLTWTAKFIHDSMHQRAVYHLNAE